MDDAVVLGASLAGLLSALVLAEAPARVTLVERDLLPPGPSAVEARTGVPQAHHPHVLLAGGSAALEELLPGLGDQLLAAGAVPLDGGTDLAVWGPGGRTPPVAGGPSMLGVSRGLLERLVRERVLAHPRIALTAGSVACGLRAESGWVRAVVLRDSGPGDSGLGDSGEREVDADLVVDATGRGSRAPAWLRELGRAAPPRTVVDPHQAYAARTYRAPEGWTADWRALYAPPVAASRTAAARTAGAVLVPVEGGRWCVGLSGRGGQQPPTDEEGFLAYAAAIGVPELTRALAAAVPVGEAHRSRSAVNRWDRYDLLRDPLPGLVVVGDAVAAFNPVHGQGMTVAALGALALRDAVRAGAAGGGLGSPALPGRAARALARVVAVPWLLSTGADARFATTTGARSGSLERVVARVGEGLQQRGDADPVLRRAQMEVLHLLAPPTRLLSPRMLLRSAVPRPRRPAPA